MDLLPTLLEMIGADIPDGMQGRSFLPLIHGHTATPRDFIVAELNTTAWNVARCIRTASHKYIETADPGPLWHFPTDIEQSKTRRDMSESPCWQRPPRELYDLRTDPLEMHNLAGQHEYDALQKNCAHILHRFQQETGDPLLKGPIPRPPDEADILNRILAAIPGANPPKV